MSDSTAPAAPDGRTRRKVALVLQGGGALGAYHVGAYKALHEADLLDTGGNTLDWVSGISIGAFNAAIIAGNLPEHRLARLDEFWSIISRPDDWAAGLHAVNPKLYNQWNYWEALTLGQPNFFVPRFPGPYFLPGGDPGATSFYDTGPLRETLRRVADFDLINRHLIPTPGEMAPPRISLGATDVESGEMEFFDNTKLAITPEHVMASGSLPPGFPAQRIGGRQYWDGACVSNTALNALLHEDSPEPILAFVIDLWSPVGPAPTTMDEVQWRQKQIQYASRTDRAIRAVATKHALRQVLGAAGEGYAGLPEDALLAAKGLDIVHVVYHPAAEQGPGSDAEFSRFSIEERRAAGFSDMKAAIAQAPWARPAAGNAPPGGVRVHQMAGGTVLGSYDAAQVATGEMPAVGKALVDSARRGDATA